MADITGLAEHFGYGRISVVHFDAHADTGDIQFGSLYGHGLPMRRVIESGAVRGDRFLQIGLRGYWPEPPELLWMAEQGMRCYEMAEIQRRGLDEVLTEALAIAVDDTDGVYLSVDIDVVDPGTAPGTGTPEPGGLTARELLDAVRRIGRDVPLVGLEIVEVAPPVRPRRHHRDAGQSGGAGDAVGDRPAAGGRRGRHQVGRVDAADGRPGAGVPSRCRRRWS